MTIAFGFPTDYTTLLSALQQQIVSSGVVSLDYCYALLEDLNTPGDWPTQDLVVTIAGGEFPVDQTAVAGGGTHPEALLVEGVLAISLWVRLGLDQPMRDAIYLTEITRGAWNNWHAILRALHLFLPNDGNGNYLTVEPVRFLSWHFGKRDPRLGWGRVRGLLEVKYVQDLT
jgi:hypothetical protein